MTTTRRHHPREIPKPDRPRQRRALQLVEPHRQLGTERRIPEVFRVRLEHTRRRPSAPAAKPLVPLHSATARRVCSSRPVGSHPICISACTSACISAAKTFHPLAHGRHRRHRRHRRDARSVCLPHPVNRLQRLPRILLHPFPRYIPFERVWSTPKRLQLFNLRAQPHQRPLQLPRPSLRHVLDQLERLLFRRRRPRLQPLLQTVYRVVHVLPVPADRRAQLLHHVWGGRVIAVGQRRLFDFQFQLHRVHVRDELRRHGGGLSLQGFPPRAFSFQRLCCSATRL